MKIIVEVGANLGTDTGRMFNESTEPTLIYAIEPTPHCLEILHAHFDDNPNIIIVPVAIDDVDGSKLFNIAGHSDWGCSSLHEFVPGIEEKYPHFPDLHYTDSVVVNTMRLDTFMDIHNIKQIDYLWIDAQGNDFVVLKSLGDKIGCVVAGQCEVQSTSDAEIYHGVVNDYDSVNAWLNDNGFDTRPRGGVGIVNEMNLYFTRRATP